LQALQERGYIGKATAKPYKKALSDLLCLLDFPGDVIGKQEITE
jgi:hypothetical protein